MKFCPNCIACIFISDRKLPKAPSGVPASSTVEFVICLGVAEDDAIPVVALVVCSKA